MKEKLQIVARIAGTDSSVWLIGEGGVGKELVAERIHAESGRGEKSLLKINCARSDAAPLDFEGAGAGETAEAGAGETAEAGETARERETADGRASTVFFDEIACLSGALQEDLLGLLKRKADSSRDGGGFFLPRIIASTRHDIEKMVDEGAFNRELYYRLNVLPIFIPPLRDRKEDILPLAGHFLSESALDMKKRAPGWTDEAKEALLSHPWTGNARELKNCVERALLHSSKLLLDTADLFGYAEGGVYGERDLKIAVGAFKASHIVRVLEQTRWNQTAAAKTMGIQRTYLSKLMKGLQIKKGE
jgi:Nif-specific regulatory protein